jgi:hypothetical protein
MSNLRPMSTASSCGAEACIHLSISTRTRRTVRYALGLLRDLLGPGMRLREKLAGGNAYRWFLEATTASGWQVEYETTLLLWNVLGRRSERIYRNTHLPVRES